MAVLGEMAIVMEKLELLLVENTIFVAQCALDDLTPADQIFWHAYRPEPTDGESIRPCSLGRPFIVIKADSFTYQSHSVGCMMPKMTPKIHINDRVRNTSFQESSREFSTFVGQLMDELSSTTMQDDGLVIKEMTMSTPPTPVARREQNEDFAFWFCEYELNIGADFE